MSFSMFKSFATDMCLHQWRQHPITLSNLKAKRQKSAILSIYLRDCNIWADQKIPAGCMIDMWGTYYVLRGGALIVENQYTMIDSH